MNLYIGCNGNVAAIDPNSGQELWRVKLSEGFFSSSSYQDVCILEHEGVVYAGCYGHLYALEASSGQLLWHNELKGMGHNEVTLSMAGKSVQFVSKHTHSSS